MNGHSDFEALESALPDMVHTFLSDPEALQCLVIVPSMSFDQELLKNVLGVEHYEERLLAMLLQLLLAMHVIFCSSAPIADVTVDYYLGLIPGVPSSHARSRLTMISCDDLSRRPADRKLLERPARLAEIKRHCRTPRSRRWCA